MNAPLAHNSPACPCCGAPVDPLAVLVDMASGVVTLGGRATHLTPTEVAMFDLLVKGYPAVTTRERIYDDLYSNRPECDWPEVKTIDILICKLRRKLSAIDLEINTIWGRGWVLSPPLASSEALLGLGRQRRRRRA